MQNGREFESILWPCVSVDPCLDDMAWRSLADNAAWSERAI